MAMVGYLSSGRVDQLGTEYVATKLLVLVLPLFPIGSYYAISSKGGRYRGFNIPFHFKSIFFAFARWWLGIIGVLMGVIAVVAIGDHDPDDATVRIVSILVSTGALAGWAACTFFLGKSNSVLNRQRRVFKSIVGFGADPRILTRLMRSNVLEQLRRIAASQGIPTDSSRLITASLDADILPLIFTIAMYEGAAQPKSDWNIIAANAWIKLDNANSSTFVPLAKPIVPLDAI